MSCDELPLADPSREAEAKQIFPLDMSPELYAAREAHHWYCFSFDQFRYSDEALTRWIHRFADVAFSKNGAPLVDKLRLELLTAEERAAIDDEIRQEREAYGL